jgi:hypothetical protein
MYWLYSDLACYTGFSGKLIKVVGFCSTFKHCTLVVFLSLLNLLICNVKIIVLQLRSCRGF